VPADLFSRRTRQDRTVIANLTDLNALGLGLDIGGAYYLGRGLLASPREIVRRSTSFFDVSGPLAVSYSADRADGLIGFSAIAGGFFIQAIAYVVSAGGWGAGSTRPAAAAVAIVAAGVGLGVVVMAHKLLHERLIRGTLARAVMVDYRTGEIAENASWTLVYIFGRELGKPLTPSEVNSLQGGDGAVRYARRVFGVSGVAADEIELTTFRP
jgi:hypothetical protein